MDQESRLYYNFYLQIDDVVKRIAMKDGIALVMRHSTEQIKEDDQNSIVRWINRPVVYYHGSIASLTM